MLYNRRLHCVDYDVTGMTHTSVAHHHETGHRFRCFHWESLRFCHTLILSAISQMAFRDIHWKTGLNDWVLNTCNRSFTFCRPFVNNMTVILLQRTTVHLYFKGLRFTTEDAVNKLRRCEFVMRYLITTWGYSVQSEKSIPNIFKRMLWMALDPATKSEIK